MIIANSSFRKGMGEVEGAGARKSEIFFDNNSAQWVHKNDLWIDRDGEVEFIFFEIANDSF